MQRQSIKLEERSLFGKKVRRLRKDGVLPVTIYGRDIKSVSAQLPLKEFKNLYKMVHETGLVDLEIGKKTLPVLIHNTQIDPRSQEIIHADFYNVNLKEKIKSNIPVVAKGEPQAVLDKKGLLLQLLSEVEVEALPTDLPGNIEVNVEKLKEVDEEIPVSELKVPSGVAIINEPNQIVFKIGELVSRETEEQVAAEEAAAAEASAEVAPAEGEAEAAPEAATEVAPAETAKEEAK